MMVRASVTQYNEQSARSAGVCIKAPSPISQVPSTESTSILHSCVTPAPCPAAASASTAVCRPADAPHAVVATATESLAPGSQAHATSTPCPSVISNGATNPKSLPKPSERDAVGGNKGIGQPAVASRLASSEARLKMRRSIIMEGSPTAAMRRSLIADSVPSASAAAAQPCQCSEPQQGSDVVYDPEGDANGAGADPLRSSVTSAQVAVTAATLGLRVCGVDLGRLFSEQIADEIESNRVISAFKVLAQSVAALTPKTIGLMLKIKEPPDMLASVLNGLLVLLKLPEHPKETAKSGGRPLPAASQQLDPALVLTRMATVDLEAISNEQVAPLEEKLAEIGHGQVRERYGIAAHVWAWVSAVCLICGSAPAILPGEDRMTIRKARNACLARGAPRPERARTCAGAPFTGLPSYSPNPSSIHSLSSPSNWMPRHQSPAAQCPASPNSGSCSTRPQSPIGGEGGHNVHGPLHHRPSMPSPCSSRAQSPVAIVEPQQTTLAESSTQERPPAPLSAGGESVSELDATTLPRPPRIAPQVQSSQLTCDIKANHSATNVQSASASMANEEHHTKAPQSSAKQNAKTERGMPAGGNDCAQELCLQSLIPLRFLGAGGFANVFMCRHQPTGKIVALKCILKSLVLRKKKQRQVLAEKQALMCSPHPCIIQLLASISDTQHLYFAMEIALGGELFALLEEKNSLPEQAARYYAGALTLAIGHLHSHGFIYRDLKPENVLLDIQGNLKLCDLGLAKRAERAWSVVGTPQYLAPELLRGEGATTAADWWGLGVLTFEMITGDLPFTSPDGSDQALFKSIKRGTFVWPTSRASNGISGACSGSSNEPGGEDGNEQPRRRILIPIEQTSTTVRDFVNGLLRQHLPPAAAAAPHSVSATQPQSIDPLRIGAGETGSAEIQSHAWFSGFRFDAVIAGEYPPPFLPNLRGKEDDGNFGPIEWRGEPIMSSPEYDQAIWAAGWNANGW